MATKYSHNTLHAQETANNECLSILPQKQNNNPLTTLVLLVEDAPIALTIAESVVRQANCRFISATTGEQALELFKQNPVDFVLTDIGLPGISGNVLATMIRTYEKQTQKQPVPIVGLTAHAIDTAMSESIESGMNTLLSKPLKLETFNQVLCDLCQQLKKNSTNESLGKDLPETENELFELAKLPFIDINQGVKNLGSLLKELLQMMIGTPLTEDMLAIQTAYDKKDWDKVEALAHKIKSGSLYCATTQLTYACQYLERYHKAGHSKLLEALYQQFYATVEQTKKAVNNWLLDQSL